MTDILQLDDDVRPTTLGACSEDDCPSWDGKRCRLTGNRPRGGCEPAFEALLAKADDAKEMHRQLDAAEKRVEELMAIVVTVAGAGPFDMIGELTVTRADGTLVQLAMAALRAALGSHHD
jgi:hypothetical protein